jgi:hypothetical protein
LKVRLSIILYVKDVAPRSLSSQKTAAPYAAPRFHTTKGCEYSANVSDLALRTRVPEAK